MTLGRPPFPAVDFAAFHRDELPALLAAHAEVVARRPDGLQPLALAVGDDAVTYRTTPDGVEAVPGDDAPTVVELTPAAWSDFAHELRLVLLPRLCRPGALPGGAPRAVHALGGHPAGRVGGP